MSQLFKNIEEGGEKLGKNVKKGKCEYLRFGNAGLVHFIDGTELKVKTEAKYLGRALHVKGRMKQHSYKEYLHTA